MVAQYPHQLVITKISGSTQDSNGNWQAGVVSKVEKSCRAEPNNKNALVKTVDGTQIIFDYTVYMPLPVDPIPVGSKVSVYDGDVLLSTNTVKRFSKGELNARLWL